ncbi:MAG: pyrroloquinoline quinone precursor peptide PqqA [Myxococcota bacterium]
MKWTKPQWTEIPVGMEIGAYRAPEPEDAPQAPPPPTPARSGEEAELERPSTSTAR